MALHNNNERYGWLAQFFHWSSALCFIASYFVVYYVLWFIGTNKDPRFIPTLNVHWVLGIVVGILVLPRLLWRLREVAPDQVPGSRLEHLTAHWAHWALYAFLIVMPLTGYLGTRHFTDFGLFIVPSFKDTALFAWIAATWEISFQEFEQPIDAVHHFLGKWVVWIVVLLHIAAALFHHWVRRDAVLRRMLPGAH